MKIKHIRFEDLILYNDEDLLAINKPTGYSSLSERFEPDTGLLEMGRKLFPDLKLCHRLDKYTTGILLFAHHAEAYRNLSIQFQKREVQKIYKTVINEARHFDHLEVKAPLSPIIKGTVRIDYKDGKPALTLVHSEKIFRGHTYVRCQPLTGRSHQIRVHMAYLKCPIVGDLLYGGKNLYLSEFKRKYRLTGDQDEYPLNDNYLLHAESITCKHPTKNEDLTLSAPFPKNFRVILELLEKHDQ